MVAPSLFSFDDEVTTEPISLRLVVPETFDVRITNPHVRETGDLEAIYESMRTENRDPLPELSDEERLHARREMSLPKIYETYLADWRSQRRRDGKLAGGTLQKERQSLRCFGAWDADPQRAPRDWPRGVPWTGLPAGYLAQRYLERWLRSRLDEGYSDGTMEPRWNHVRTVLNMIRRMGIIDEIPVVEYSGVVAAWQKSVGAFDDDLVPTTYTSDQLQQIYSKLHEPDMRTALVLGLNCGPRSVDLFGLFWSTNVRLGDRPELFYTALKTGKRHWVPLHPVTVSHLRRLIAVQGHLDPERPEGQVFPRLTSHAVDSEKSRPARRRNKRMKSVLSAIGLPTDGDYDKPWQVLRSTCNSLLNNHRPGAGMLVTHGKDADVSSQNYWNHHPTLVEAIATLPMPLPAV